MIKITDKYIKEGQLDKEALVKLGADVVEIQGDKIIFKNDVVFSFCDLLVSVSDATFNGNVDFEYCHSLKSVDGATFNNWVLFWGCVSLTSIDNATFKYGFQANRCFNLKQ